MIVIQDKDAYCHRQDMWGANETAVSGERVLFKSIQMQSEVETRFKKNSHLPSVIFLLFFLLGVSDLVASDGAEGADYQQC